MVYLVYRTYLLKSNKVQHESYIMCVLCKSLKESIKDSTFKIKTHMPISMSDMSSMSDNTAR